MAVGPDPFSQFGLPATPPVEGEPPKPDPIAAVVAENTALKARLDAAEGKLSKLPENFEGWTKKAEIVDRLVKALAGDGEPANAQQYRDVFKDLKEVARHAAPGFYKAMQLLEQDPDAIEKLGKNLDQIAIQRIAGFNEQAHGLVMDAAKEAGLTRGMSAADIAEYVFPFETSITAVINSNEQLRRAFLAGNVAVVKDLFARIAKPHINQRLKQKQERVASTNFPKAPPRAGAEPGAGAGEPARPNIRTPQGKMAFHKGAVNRWLDKVSSRDE